MNNYIVFGLFALYAACVSLVLVLSGAHDALLGLLRRFWGRTLGHSLYFLCNVALPVVVCALCLGWGVRQYDASVAYLEVRAPMTLNLDYYRNLPPYRHSADHERPEVIYGA